MQLKVLSRPGDCGLNGVAMIASAAFGKQFLGPSIGRSLHWTLAADGAMCLVLLMYLAVMSLKIEGLSREFVLAAKQSGMLWSARYTLHAVCIPGDRVFGATKGAWL